MRKIIFGIFAFAFAVTLIAVANPAYAKNNSSKNNKCESITGKDIVYQTGRYLEDQTIPTGFDVFGYNYNGHMFSGNYANAYLNKDGLPPYLGDAETYLADNPSAEAKWYWPYRDIQLAMKWNDAWLANTDCEPDGELDRHFDLASYRDSGAWLTNHASGTYQGSEYEWNVSGDWLLDYNGGAGNREFRNLVQDSEGNVTGEFWYLAGTWLYGGTLEGMVDGDTLSLHYERPSPLTYTGDFEGTIGDNVITDGTFSDNKGNINLPWTAEGTSVKTYETCEVSDFVKIVAAPADATLEVDGWHAADGSFIGPEIWGDFAIIQEQASDPCEEYGVLNVKGDRPGLGNW